MKITKQEFARYEDCRKQGITNMFLKNNVSAITQLSEEKIVYIMENYEKLRQRET